MFLWGQIQLSLGFSNMMKEWGIKFCPTASFASASQLKKQTVFCEVVHVVRSCTYFLVPVLHAGYVRYYTALSQSKLNLSKIVFDSLNVHLYLV